MTSLLVVAVYPGQPAQLAAGHSIKNIVLHLHLKSQAYDFIHKDT
jgi:hypothetical protein